MRYFIILSILISLFLCSLNNVFGSAEGSKERLLHEQYTHTVDLRSLLPATTCNPSTKGNKRKTSLELVHKHGPCSHLPQHKATATNHTQILEQDQARVNLINSRISKKLNGNDDLGQSEATTLPSRWATSRGAGNYIVTVGLGTPNKQLSLEFDTGSFLTWTQCQPCVSYCYPQNDPIFDPAASTSYAKISCNSAECAQLRRSQCSSAANTCLYQVIYGDKSHTIGFFSKDKLTLTPDDVFDGFLFGCGQENVGFQDGSAGLLGLSRDKYSIVEQTAVKYDRSFSYCLPPTASSTGYLTFGSPTGASNAAIKYTRLTTLSSSSTYYGLNLVGINVNGQKLSIPASEFSSPGTIIDSGTVLSRLSPTAFSALRDAFQVAMESYPSVPGDGFLDTCYDLSGYPTVTYPKIEFVFGDGVTLTLDATGIVYLADGTMKQVCLAFVGNDDADKVTIFGNTQQKNMEVLYDVAGERVGFAPGGC